MALGQARACERLADAVAALQAAVRREVEEGGLSGDGTIRRGAGDAAASPPLARAGTAGASGTQRI